LAKPSNKQPSGPPVILNRRAFHDYEIVEEIEAGIVLVGCEVKMIRQGSFTLQDAYAEIKDGQVWLVNSNIPPYPQASTHEVAYKPLRARKLLLHRAEIGRLRRKVIEKGFTLIPLKAYFKAGHVKVQLGLARGKKQYDKRESIKQQDMKMDAARAGGRR
jgi:SsrA-binding protein